MSIIPDTKKRDFTNTLRITEIFYSLQGETRTIGLPTVFVRLTGCPLRCGYCDTEYAFFGGKIQTIDNIINTIAKYKAKYITVTGGEPLAQKGCIKLLEKLCDLDYRVSLETSGALDISNVDKRVVTILDLKTPGSKMSNKNLYTNLDYLDQNKDQIKFVLCDYQDYLWAKEIISKYNLINKAEVLLSPSFGEVDLKDLAKWILEDNLQVRMQLQLHKYIWGDEKGR
tara:strand:+ start:9515 stop:10195 length:681 start_codon:yes stop_codon:yes gene_type:complete